MVQKYSDIVAIGFLPACIASISFRDFADIVTVTCTAIGSVIGMVAAILSLVIRIRKLRNEKRKLSASSSAGSLGLCVIVPLLFSGCWTVHDVPAVRGGRYEVVKYAFPASAPVAADGTVPVASGVTAPVVMQREVVEQGENADGATKIHKSADGVVRIEMSGNRSNVTTVLPVPDYTKYISLVVCLLLAGGGAVLCGAGWSSVGVWLLGFGGAGGVVSLTVDSMGWLYAAVIAAVAVVFVWVRLRGYVSGVQEAAAPDTLVASMIGRATGAA
jgi:hypothetical protein